MTTYWVEAQLQKFDVVFEDRWHWIKNAMVWRRRFNTAHVVTERSPPTLAYMSAVRFKRKVLSLASVTMPSLMYLFYLAPLYSEFALKVLLAFPYEPLPLNPTHPREVLMSCPVPPISPDPVHTNIQALSFVTSETLQYRLLQLLAFTPALVVLPYSFGGTYLCAALATLCACGAVQCLDLHLRMAFLCSAQRIWNQDAKGVSVEQLDVRDVVLRSLPFDLRLGTFLLHLAFNLAATSISWDVHATVIPRAQAWVYASHIAVMYFCIWLLSLLDPLYLRWVPLVVRVGAPLLGLVASSHCRTLWYRYASRDWGRKHTSLIRTRMRIILRSPNLPLMLVHGFFGLSSFLFCWLRCKSWDVSLQMNNPRFSTISRNEVKFLSLTLFSYLTAVTVHLWLPHFNVHVSLQSRSRVFIFSCLSAIHLAFQWLLLILLGGVQYNFLPSVIFGTAIISGWALVVFPQWLRVSFDPLIYPWLSWLWQFAGIVGTLLLLGVSDITNRLRPFEDEVVWSYILLAWQTPLVLLLFHFAKYEGRVRLNGLPVVCVIDEEVLPVPKLCWRSDATIPFFHPRLYQSECSAEDVIFTGHSAAELTEKMRVLFEGKSDQTQDTKVDAKARLQLRLQQLIQSGDSDETSERRSDGESFDERPGSAEVSREAMHAWTFGVDEDAWWQGYVDSPPTMQRHSFAERNRAASDLDRVHSLWDSSQPEDSRPRLLDDLGQLSWLDSAEERVSRQTPILQTLGSLSGLHSTSDCEGNRDESEEAPFIHPQYVLEALDGQHDDAQERLEDLVSEGEDQVSSP